MLGDDHDREGRYGLVSIVEYPDEAAAFKARTKIVELGLFHIEAAVAFPVEAYIETLADKKLLVTA